MRDVRPDAPGFRPFSQRLDPCCTERRVLARRLAGPHAEHAGALDEQQIGPREANAAGETDHQQTRAPCDAAHTLLEHRTADRIEYDVGAAAVGEPFDGIAQRLVSYQNLSLIH